MAMVGTTVTIPTRITASCHRTVGPMRMEGGGANIHAKTAVDTLIRWGTTTHTIQMPEEMASENSASHLTTMETVITEGVLPTIRTTDSPSHPVGQNTIEIADLVMKTLTIHLVNLTRENCNLIVDAGTIDTCRAVRPLIPRAALIAGVGGQGMTGTGIGGLTTGTVIGGTETGETETDIGTETGTETDIGTETGTGITAGIPPGAGANVTIRVVVITTTMIHTATVRGVPSMAKMMIVLAITPTLATMNREIEMTGRPAAAIPVTLEKLEKKTNAAL